MTISKQPPKTHVNFRLSPAGLKLLTRLAKQLGIGRAACIDLAVRELARVHLSPGAEELMENGQPYPGCISVAEICKRLGLGSRKVYGLLETEIIPSDRTSRGVEKRYLIRRQRYEEWENLFGEWVRKEVK